MDCKETREQLSAYIDKKLDERTKLSVDRHLRGCTRCARELNELKAAITSVKSVRHVKAPADFLAKLRERIDEPVTFWERAQRFIFPEHRARRIIPLQLAGLLATFLIVVLYINLRKEPRLEIPQNMVLRPIEQEDEQPPAFAQTMQDAREMVLDERLQYNMTLEKTRATTAAEVKRYAEMEASKQGAGTDAKPAAEERGAADASQVQAAKTPDVPELKKAEFAAVTKEQQASKTATAKDSITIEKKLKNAEPAAADKLPAKDSKTPAAPPAAKKDTAKKKTAADEDSSPLTVSGSKDLQDLEAEELAVRIDLSNAPISPDKKLAMATQIKSKTAPANITNAESRKQSGKTIRVKGTYLNIDVQITLLTPDAEDTEINIAKAAKKTRGKIILTEYDDTTDKPIVLYISLPPRNYPPLLKELAAICALREEPIGAPNNTARLTTIRVQLAPPEK
ncbi:MAG: zf-HC2 domain-containing protein [Elusimicrobiota bacterium]